VVRLVAVLGLEKALPFLLEGKQLGPADAVTAGLVDEVVREAKDLVPAAKAWIRANPGVHQQPWDRKNFRYPGGDALSPQVRQVATMASVALGAQTRGLTPAPERILDVAVNSMRMGFDSALRAESRALVALIGTPQAKAAITTFFFGMQAIKAGKVRPAGERWRARSTAVLGAGMMGGGIAWAHASKRLPTALKDTTLEKAQKGKAYSAQLCEKAVKRGSMTEAARAELLATITPTVEDGAYRGSDLIVEAVFEDLDLKEKVIAQTFPMLSEQGIYATNTSGLSISVLAESCPDPTRFVGLHFFSPVDKMKIVEIVLGKKTSDETLRKAYDYVQQIGYLPIVVNDSPAFFTTRVFATFLDEGLQLLQDGLKPASIERAAWKAGMPVGPLAVHDEVSIELSRKAMATQGKLDARLGRKNAAAENSAIGAIAPVMCELGRGGRNRGAGFYEYASDGTKRLWAGLERFKVRDRAVPILDAVDRLLYRQAIETLRCLDEGVLRTEVEGNLGSIKAIGFPPHTGGALQFIRGIGLDTFARRADELASRYGERFRVAPAALEKLRVATNAGVRS
jgi:3-hydroxyacyl-CoA dehydrogenase/enoyl-CoA hydratase/3-hydroxybutyryl-CoA epimerase